MKDDCGFLNFCSRNSKNEENMYFKRIGSKESEEGSKKDLKESEKGSEKDLKESEEGLGKDLKELEEGSIIDLSSKTSP